MIKPIKNLRMDIRDITTTARGIVHRHVSSLRGTIRRR